MDVESIAKAVKQVDGVPTVSISGKVISLGYPTLATYESRCSADDAAVRKAAKVSSVEVDGTHAQGACVVKFTCA